MIKLEIPRTSERIRGITLPNNGVMYVADYDEVFKITLDDKATVETLDNDPYEFLESQEYFIGVSNHKPITKSNGNKITYTFWPPVEYGTLKHKLRKILGLNKDHITVKYHISKKTGKIRFRTLSGDWFAASFSKDGKYLVIAEPYDFDVYKIA